METCGNDNDGRSVIEISNVVVKFTCKAILKVLDNVCPFLKFFFLNVGSSHTKMALGKKRNRKIQVK